MEDGGRVSDACMDCVSRLVINFPLLLPETPYTAPWTWFAARCCSSLALSLHEPDCLPSPTTTALGTGTRGGHGMSLGGKGKKRIALVHGHHCPPSSPAHASFFFNRQPGSSLPLSHSHSLTHSALLSQRHPSPHLGVPCFPSLFLLFSRSHF